MTKTKRFAVEFTTPDGRTQRAYARNMREARRIKTEIMRRVAVVAVRIVKIA